MIISSIVIISSPGKVRYLVSLADRPICLRAKPRPIPQRKINTSLQVSVSPNVEFRIPHAGQCCKSYISIQSRQAVGCNVS